MEPRIAYYCRLYAVEEGLKLQNRDKAIDELLFSVMDKLESYKSKNTLVPEEDKLQLEGFALKIFDRADRVDRAGRADMSTCKAHTPRACSWRSARSSETWTRTCWASRSTQRGRPRTSGRPSGREGSPRSGQVSRTWPAQRFVLLCLVSLTLSLTCPPQKNAGVLEKNYEAGDKVVCKEGESALPVEGAVLSAMGSTFLVSLPSGTKVSPSEAWAWRTTADRADPKLTLLFNTHSLSGAQGDPARGACAPRVHRHLHQGRQGGGGQGAFDGHHRVATVVRGREGERRTISTEEQHIRVTAPAPTPHRRAPPALSGHGPRPAGASGPPPAPRRRPRRPPMTDAPRPPPRRPKAVPGSIPSLLQMNDAQRQAKVAVSSGIPGLQVCHRLPSEHSSC